MGPHVCPWWGGYFIDNRLRRWFHNPERILSPHLRPGMSVMDFGCGMGLFAIAAARLVGQEGRVVAVDLQPQMLDVLRHRATQAGVAERIHTHQCQADTIALSDCFDFALAFYSAHETPDLRHLLGEIHALLRPQGQLLVVEPILHVTAKDFDRVLAIAAEIGFQERQRPHVRLSRAVLLQRQA